MSLALRYLAYLVASAGLALLARWTWRRLWRRGRNRWEHLVYDHGVRRVGALMWVLSTLYLPISNAWERGIPILSALVLSTVLLQGLVGVTTCLWLGYWAGRIMAALLGVPRSDEPER